MERTLEQQPPTGAIPGYSYGKPDSARSPISIADLRQIEETAGWTKEDAETLRRHGDIFQKNAEKMVDLWRAEITRQPHLAKWFFNQQGKPDEEYKARVKQRFVQWVLDAVFKPHDQNWLDYQEEIGLRHTPEEKNITDHAHSPALVPLRYVIAFTSVVAISARKIFAAAGIGGEELQKLSDAWARAVQLHVTLWTEPYMKPGLW